MTDSARSGGRARLVDLLHHDARHFGSKPAVRIDGKAITYRELEQRAAEATRVLGKHIKAGDRVAIWLQNSFAWVASFLALNSLGAVAVPVNTRLTPAELSVIIGDAQVRALITTPHYRGRDYVDEALAILSPESKGVLVYAVADDLPATDWRRYGDLGKVSVSDNAIATTVADLLCIQYTSGTTATPKGVMLTNRSYLLTSEGDHPGWRRKPGA